MKGIYMRKATIFFIIIFICGCVTTSQNYNAKTSSGEIGPYILTENYGGMAKKSFGGLFPERPKWMKDTKLYKQTYGDDVTRHWFVYKDTSGVLINYRLIAVHDLACKPDDYIVDMLHTFIDVMGEPDDVRVSVGAKVIYDDTPSVSIDKGINSAVSGEHVWFTWKWKGVDVWFIYLGQMKKEGWKNKKWCIGKSGYVIKVEHPLYKQLRKN